MTALEVAELVVRVGAVALTVLAVTGSAVGALAGSRVPASGGSGLARHLRASAVYLIGAAVYYSVCVSLWTSLPVEPIQAIRWALLAGGSLLGLAGAAVYLGARHALGPMYNVSSALGSELYVDQRLVDGCLYGRVRHPMYDGLALAAAGALLVFRTWTFVFVIATLPLFVVKALREEALLATRFGQEWKDYAARVPRWIPRRHAPAAREVTRVGTPAR